jgi:hypothetical protein
LSLISSRRSYFALGENTSTLCQSPRFVYNFIFISRDL